MVESLHVDTKIRRSRSSGGGKNNVIVTDEYRLRREAMISIPITLDQIIVAIKQLQPEDQAQVAQVLCQTGLRSDLAVLIQELYTQSPDDDITDNEIMAEIKAVRQQVR